MPRILVADDNSNIQKMVTLALKDVGIDVVAVPNGEAAVRKLTDSTLDLVLADIFMPVRSGYEVCEFIKQDPRYSHLPVVLLVGAFDPLDEREAQRVGADGILKKPFVPPDPLINMVKALLAKSFGERLVTVAAPAAGSAAASSAGAPPAFPPKRAPDLPLSHPTADFSDVPPDEFAAPASRLDFDEHENNPVAFSALLDAPATDEQDLTVTASRDPVLGEPAFWSKPAATEDQPQVEEESEEEAIREHSWDHSQPLPFAIAPPTLPTVERDASSFSISPETSPHVQDETGMETGDEISAEAIPEITSDSTSTIGSVFDSDISPALTEEASANGNKSSHLVEPEIDRTVDLGAELAAEIHAIEPREVKPSEDRENVLQMPSAAATDFAKREHALTSTPPLSEVEKFLSDLVSTSEEPEEPSSVAAIEHAAAPPAPAEVMPEPEHFEASEMQEAAAPAVEAAIDTQKIEVPEGGNLRQDAPPVATKEVAHLDPLPTLDEMPGWMASVSTIFPPMQRSLEDAARAELESASRANVATPEATAIETTVLSENTELEEDFEKDLELEVPLEPARVSAHLLPTTKWPPAFEPKLSVEHAPSASIDESQPVAPAPVPVSALPAENAALASPTIQSPAVQTPEMLEAIVTRIVERMQPQVIEVVTREILRPLVDALVRREIDKGK